MNPLWGLKLIDEETGEIFEGSQKHESSLGIETSLINPAIADRIGSQKHESSLGIETCSTLRAYPETDQFPKA